MTYMVIRNAHIWVENGHIRIEPFPDKFGGFEIVDSWIQDVDASNDWYTGIYSYDPDWYTGFHGKPKLPERDWRNLPWRKVVEPHYEISYLVRYSRGEQVWSQWFPYQVPKHLDPDIKKALQVHPNSVVLGKDGGFRYRKVTE